MAIYHYYEGSPRCVKTRLACDVLSDVVRNLSMREVLCKLGMPLSFNLLNV